MRRAEISDFPKLYRAVAATAVQRRNGVLERPCEKVGYGFLMLVRPQSLMALPGGKLRAAPLLPNPNKSSAHEPFCALSTRFTEWYYTEAFNAACISSRGARWTIRQ
jgi:hypothetical protein